MNYQELLNPYYWSLLHWQVFSTFQTIVLIYMWWRRSEPSKKEQEKLAYIIKTIKVIIKQLVKLVSFLEQSPKR